MDRHITTTLLITAAILTIGHGAGLLISPQLFRSGIIGITGVEIGWTLIAIIPAAIAGIVIFARGHRAGYWAWILAPGIAIWVMRPFGSFDQGWQLHWAVKLIKAYAEQIWPVIWHGKTMTPPAIAFFTGGLVMAIAGASISGFTIRQFKKDLRRAGRSVGKGPGGGTGRDGLPQHSFASARQVRDNFSHPGGIVLGEQTDPLRDSPKFNPAKPRTWGRQGRGRLITMDLADGNGHVVVLAASAGYKTSGIVISNILHYDGPLVVFDPKGDLYERTKDARKAMGYDAVTIDASNGFDPFKMIAPLAKQVPSVYHTMAKQLMPLSSRPSDISEYFHEMSVSLFAALTAHFVEENVDNVARAISIFINRPRETVIIEAQAIAEKYDLAFVADELQGLSAIDERTWPGVMKGITNKLSFIQYPDIAQYATSAQSPEDHLAALGPKTDIFISIPSLSAQHFSPFPRLLIGAMFVASELLEQPDRPRARRLFLIDEARVLGGMDVLNNVRDAGRSIGMHLMLIYQSLGQLQEAWGNAGADAWLDSCEARVLSAVGSSRTAADISAMLGQRNIRVTTEGSSSQHQVMSPMGGSVSSSESEQLREIPLMAQAALGQLPAHGCIILNRRIPPILATKAMYFTRKDMRDRVKSPESVSAKLDVTRRREAVMQAIRDSKEQKDGDSKPGDDGGGNNGAPPAPASSVPETPSQAPRPKPASLSSGPTDASVGRKFISFARRHLPSRASKAASATDKQATPAQPAASVPTVIRPQDCYPSHPDRAQICAAYFGIPADKLVFAWTPKHVPGWLRPVWDLWALYMVQRPNTPLNLRNVTHEIIPHPRDVQDGLWIVRMWDRINWYFSHPDGRYEVYDLKRRRRQWDGLEWRLHLLKCWIRNEPRGLPPGLQPSTDYPDHDTLRIRISPATRTLEPTNARYDPIANAVWLPHTDKGPAPPSAEWDPRDVGPVPPDPPPQLVFEHVATAGFTIVDGVPVAGDITDMSDDPLEWPNSPEFLEFMSVRIPQNVFVEGILRHREPLHEHDMAFFRQWPEIPRERAAKSGIAISNSNVPLKHFASLLWIDRVGDEWRLFRQAVRIATGYPLGAARTWPIVGHTLEWLDKPIVERSIFEDAWA